MVINMNILLVEDNLSIIKGLKYVLEKNNYNLVYFENVRETKEYLKYNSNINLIILDITLPDGNGINLYKNIIYELKIPTIFLTANDDYETIVDVLDIGAQDYITKPFSTNELLARINKILLKNKKTSIVSIKDINFDMDKMIVYKDNVKIELTSLETKILYLLFSNINKVVSRNTIIECIWDNTGNDVDDHTITVYIKRIKDKIGNDIITTIKGIGYIIDNGK